MDLCPLRCRSNKSNLSRQSTSRILRQMTSNQKEQFDEFRRHWHWYDTPLWCALVAFFRSSKIFVVAFDRVSTISAFKFFLFLMQYSTTPYWVSHTIKFNWPHVVSTWRVYPLSSYDDILTRDRRRNTSKFFLLQHFSHSRYDWCKFHKIWCPLCSVTFRQTVFFWVIYTHKI